MTQTVLPSEHCPQGVREAPLFKSRTVSGPQTLRRWKREWIMLSRGARGVTEAATMPIPHCVLGTYTGLTQ